MRAIWSGSLSFGLVNIPVELVSATKDKDIHFHLLTGDGKCRLRRKLYCPDTDKEYDFKNTTRGYEVTPNQYVLVKDEELKKLKPKAVKTIELLQFFPLKEIDPIYFVNSYYLKPEDSAAKAYKLLWQALRDEGKVGFGSFVMRQKQYYCIIRPMGSVLSLVTLHYADEIVLPEKIFSADMDKIHPQPKELDIAGKLIESMTDDFDAKQYKNEYRAEVLAYLESKAKGAKMVLAGASKPEQETNVYSLMDALKKSLQKNTPRKTKAKKTAKRQKSA